MALFKRGPKPGSVDPQAIEQREAVVAFWRWWESAGRALATGAGSVGGEDLVAALTPAVAGIHADLSWEISTGADGRHLLTVSAGGVPELRAVARRWRLAAPELDEQWDYSDLRPPFEGNLSDFQLEIGGRTYAVAEASADAYVRGVTLDVSVFHPHFADLEEDDRRVVTYILLDQVLGEEAVETWLGAIDASAAPALDPVPIGGLRSVVASLREEHTTPDGRPHFAILQGTAPDGFPVLVLARIPLRPSTAPHLDTYVGIAVPYADRTPEGFPGPGSLDPLRALEDHVSERLGGSGEIVAVQSHQGLRVMHAYVDGTTPAAEQVRVAVQGWDQGQVQLEQRNDPAWSAVAHLRG
jgi:hypothetical protein